MTDGLMSLLPLLDDPNKVARKRALDKILVALRSLSKADLSTFWTDNHKAIIKRLQDDGERSREISAQCIQHILESDTALDPKLQFIVPILHRRLFIATEGTGTFLEPSEEVRAAYLRVLLLGLRSAVASESNLLPFMDDVTFVLKSCLSDAFVDVKILCCDIVQELKKVPAQFKMAAERLLNPVVKNFPHQQKKVRFTAVNAAGMIIAHCADEAFKGSVPAFAQRLFDPAPEVRLAVAQVAALLLTEWKYRYGNLAYLVPLIITNLDDEVPSVRDETRSLWESSGQAWLMEEAGRDKKIKEQVDFPLDPPKHYPDYVDRPSFGCRFLATRVFYKLKPALDLDLRDWLVETRLKTAELLRVLLIHLEAEVVQHAEEVLSLLCGGVRDSEKGIVEKICKSARLFGYFVQPRFWSELCCGRINDNPASIYELRILTCIVSGSQSETLRPALENIWYLLSGSVAPSTDDDVLSEVLSCAEATLDVCGKNAVDVEECLFKTAITAIALSHDQAVKEAGRHLLSRLETTFSHPDRDHLFKHYLGAWLKQFRSTCESWGPLSMDAPVFATLLHESDSAAGFFTEPIVAVFRTVLLPRKEASTEPPPELKLKMFLVLAQLVLTSGERLDSQGEFGEHASRVVSDILLPHLVWHSGKKAEAVRIAASSALWSILAAKSLSVSEVTSLLPAMAPRMNSLVEDDSEKVRVFVLKAFKHLFDFMGTEIPMPYLTKCSSLIVQRLDDVSDEVRLLSLAALSSIPGCVPEAAKADPQFNSFLKPLLTPMLLHMDDKEERVRAAALDTLKVVSDMNPSLILELTTSNGPRHKHQLEVEALAKHLESMKVNN